MRVELALLWLAAVLVAILFLGVRLWLRHGRNSFSASPPGEADRPTLPRTGLIQWLTEPVNFSGLIRPAAALPYSIERLRGPVTLLLVGGLTLLIMGQSVYGTLWPPIRWRVYSLVGAGLLAFMVAGFTIARRRPPYWLEQAGRWLAAFFGISANQLVLLYFAPFLAVMAGLAAGEGYLALHPVIAITAWLLALGAVIAGSYRPDTPSVRQQVSRRELFLVAALFVVAFLLRGTALTQFPNTLSGDEGSAGLMAVKFLNGEANNLFTVGWFSFPSLYFAVQGLGIAILGQTTEGLRVSSAVAGALTVVAVYWLARLMFNRKTAVLAAGYLLASHFHIHFSRIGLNNVWDGLFTALALAGLWHGWKNNSRLGWIVGGLALGLGQYFYVAFRVFPVLVLLWSGFAFLLDRPAFKRHFASLILSALVALVVFLPLGIFFADRPEEFNAPFNRVTIMEGWLDREVQITGQTPAQVVRGQMVKTALGFTHEPLRLLYDPGSPLLKPAAAILFLMGVFWAIATLDLRYLLLLLPLLSVIFLGGFSQDPPASQRYVVAIPVVAILLAVPLTQLADWLRESWPQTRRLLWPAAVLLVVWLMVADLKFYFLDVYDRYVLGGLNTIVATDVAEYLAEQEGTPAVYFFGFPRMGYFSLSTIPYLQPDIQAQDVLDPLVSEPGWVLTGPTRFIFLPERLSELQFVQLAFPVGRYQEFFDEAGTPLFMVYEVEG